ncbi:MAG: bifunctional serine/threonine-protein kinase/formylglycine-generating enzyme family protein [Chloroflexota bacterium]
MTLSQGQILNERYRIAKLLGQNEFGAVYRAWDLNADGPCALEEVFDTEAARLHFARQAPRLLALQHPGLPRVYDAFSLPGQGLYLAMNFVDGEDLQTAFERADGPLPPEQVLAWIEQVCDALAYLHAQQPPMIHGSLKPASIRITPSGGAMLVGFGTLAVFDDQTKSIPIPQAVVPGFSAPEQYSKGGMEPRSDVYALGAILYTLLSGKRLPESAMIKGKDVPPPRPLHEVNLGISPALSAVVERAIQIEPGRRFANAAELKQALGQAQVGSAPAPAAAPRKRSAGCSWAVALVVVGVLLLAAIIGGGWLAYPYIMERLATPTPTPTATATHTPVPTNTPTPVTPTATFTPAVTPTPAGLAQRIFDDFGVPMVLVESGPFLMGSAYGAMDEAPEHFVTLDTYYIDQYEVTNTRYAECVNAGRCEPPTNQGSVSHPSYYDNAEFANYPVIYVSWPMAQAYCEWRGARLPTEAEWEKAARGTDGRPFPWGEAEPDCTYANFWGGPSCIGDVGEVGQYDQGASPYNIFDMAGNVWEWVSDWYSDQYYANSPESNPRGPDSGQHRVLRGGAWSLEMMSIRTTVRGRNLPNKGYNYVGLRCVRLP